MDIFIFFHLLFILKHALSLTSIQECKPYYHFWRPYYGRIHEDAFIASERTARTYIGKIIPLDENSWTHAGPIHGYSYVDWQWPKKNMIRVNQFMEILCTEDKSKYKLEWRRIPDKTDMHIALRHCCLVESGVVRYREQDFFAYIGRKFSNGTFHVGPAYLVQDWYFPTGLYSVFKGKSIYFPEDFEILHYGCFRND